MFRRRCQVGLLLGAWVWAAAAHAQRPATTRSMSDLNRDSIRELRRAIDQQYSHRDLRGVDWDALFALWNGRLEQSASARAFASTSAAMLSVAKDVQIWLKFHDERFDSVPAIADANYNFAALAKLVPKWHGYGGVLYTGEFPDGIGYILITTFEANRLGSIEPAMQIIRNQQLHSFIIDARMVFAGDEPKARQLAGCFVQTPRVYAKHTLRQNGQTTGPSDRILEPNTSAPSSRGRVAVLMGPQCMDTGEDFLLMMKSAGATLIGGKSLGSSGHSRPFALSNGVSVYLPGWQDLRPDGSCFEAEGIAPSLPVKTTPADFGKADPVLDAALLFLRSRTLRR